jgi:glyoxylase-like metal-dependent hydrolase (beta-lactamase superfamily II)
MQMCDLSTNLPSRYVYTLILLTFFLWSSAGCVSDPDSSGQENYYTPHEVEPPAPEMAVPDGYVELIPPLPNKGYLLKELAKGVYFFSNGVYNTMFIVTSEGVVLVDPIRGAGLLLKKAMQEVTTFPIKILIYSHPHLDHIGDASLFAEEGVKIVAHKETQKLLQRYKDPARPIPQITFGEKSIIELGGVEIELIYPGDGHGKGNSMIYLPQKKLLMFVDVATPKSVPFKNFSTVDIYSQIVGLKRALQLDFDTYIAGHLYRPGKRSEMEEVLKYYLAAKRANAKAMGRIDIREVMQASQSKDIERKMGEYYEAVAEECYRLLKPEWKSRLMGFEAFARGHCDTWTAFHRTHKAP